MEYVEKGPGDMNKAEGLCRGLGIQSIKVMELMRLEVQNGYNDDVITLP